ncbi:MAG: multidrug efflux pump, partial [Thalassolituus oleivorans]
GLGWLFNRRKTLILTDNRTRLLASSLGAFVAILTMFGIAPTGTEFFPPTDPRLVNITASGPIGMTIEASNQMADEVHGRIRGLLDATASAKASVKSLLVNVGVGGDGNFGGGSASPERSRVTLNLVDYADRPEPSPATLARIRDQLQGIPGAEIEITQDSNGPPTGAPVNIEISGENFAVIQRVTAEVKQLLVEASDTGAIQGLVDVRDNLDTGRPELKVEIDRERAARFGLNTSKVASTVRSAINGAEAGKWRDGEEEYDITVRLRESDRANLESLNNLTIVEEGQQIPLTAVANLSLSGGLGSITRLDLDRVATVSADAAPGFNGQAILGEVQELLVPYMEIVPPGYRLAYTGENEEFNESFSFLTLVLLVGVSLVFMIMVAQFNSISGPFIIMVAVGLSLIGVLLGLLLTRTPYGLMTFIGVISLAGIVVNNNIVLVDYAMQLRKRGMEKHDAIIEAGATRLRPVLLTAMTTVLGLIPLTFGINIDFVGLLTNLDPNIQFGSENTQFWGPMGTAIISGLTFATFLTLVIVPVMYSVFDSVSARFSNQDAQA